MRIRVGCCGLPGGLKRYSTKLRLTEINSTFYRLPRVETAEKWRECVPKDFIFTVKCHQAISHPITSPTWRRSGLKEEELKKLKDKVGFLKPTKEVLDFWRKTLEICRILESPICLIQLPARFKDNEENMKNANEFFESIERDEIKIAVELRGWNDENIRNLCEKFDLIDCRDPFASSPTYFGKSKIAYFRLHGKPPGERMYKYKYTDKDLKLLLRKIKSLKVKEVYCLFNNIWMFENAIEFQEMVSRF